MIIYSNEEKQSIIQCIEYLRKKNSVKRNELIDGVCVEKVYRDMVKGQIKSNDEYYDKLIQFFNVQYISCYSFFKWLDDFIPRLYHACDYMDEECIQSLYQEFQLYFHDKQDYFVHKQYYQLFSYLFNYYKDDIYLNEAELVDSLSLIKIFPKDLQILLIEVMELSNWNEVGDYALFNPIFNWVKTYQDNLIMQYHLESKYQLELSFSLATECYLRILKLTPEDNEYRRLKAEIGLFSIYKNIDKEKSDEYAKLLIKAIDKKDLSIRIKKHVLTNLGNYYYMNQQYYEAIPYYKEVFQLYGRDFDLISLCMCLRQLSLDLPDCLISYNENNIFIEYFSLVKRETNNIDLENYLMSKILKELKKEPYYHPMWSFYENELSNLVKKTRRYVLFQKFRELMSKTIK